MPSNYSTNVWQDNQTSQVLHKTNSMNLPILVDWLDAITRPANTSDPLRVLFNQNGKFSYISAVINLVLFTKLKKKKGPGLILKNNPGVLILFCGFTLLFLDTGLLLLAMKKISIYC